MKSQISCAIGWRGVDRPSPSSGAAQDAEEESMSARRPQRRAGLKDAA